MAYFNGYIYTRGINTCLVAHKRAVLVQAIGFEGQLDPVDHNRCAHVCHACVTVRALRQPAEITR